MQAKLSTVTVSCLLGILSTSALADVTYSNPTAPVAKSGQYIQGSAPFVLFNLGVGGLMTPDANSNWNNSFSSAPDTVSQTDAGVTYSLGGGYLWYKNKFAYGVEADYNFYPTSDITDINNDGNRTTLDYKASSIDLMAVGQYFVASWASFQLKVGPAYVMQNTSYNGVDGSGNPVNQSANSNRVAPAFGLGMGFYPDPYVGILLGFRYITGTQPATYQSPYQGTATPTFSDYNKGTPLMDFDLGVTVNI